MRIDESVTSEIVTRLRHAERQVNSVVIAIEAGGDCTELVPRVAAASRVLNEAGFRLISSSLRQCATAPTRDGTRPAEDDGTSDADRQADLERIEKLFLSLS
jgi:DNA-binding FrmR family transcriptional regulator